MKSVMVNRYDEVPTVDVPRSSFDRSHGYKTTFDAGYLIPILVDEVYPGDTFNCNINAFVRLATPIKPVMDNMFLETFAFFVPNRLLWDNWQKFMGERDNPTDSIDFTVPIINSDAAGYANGTLHDYFGLPTKIAVSYEHSALWHRAYYLIWDEWFRDQNLQNSLNPSTGDGPDLHSAYTLQRRGKRYDYFTGCLPWPQKGDAVSIPLGDTAPVQGDGTVTYMHTLGGNSQIMGATTSNTNIHANGAFSLGGALYFGQSTNYASVGLEADLSTAVSATVNQLREAFQIQRLLERDARSGSRYIEIIKSHFGVTSPDARLQRPEYLGGGSSMISVNPVAQTSESGTTPQGNLSGVGTGGFSNGHGFVKSFVEHGVVIILANVRADLTYQQGLDRMFSRSTRYDYYFPVLANLGEQSVLNKEIYLDGSANDDLVFGYQERWAELRGKQSRITGLFRSNETTPIDYWHLSESFSTLPTLGSTFIQDDPPIDRVIKVPTEPHFLADFYFNYYCARPMPLYSTPGMIDHF